MWIIKNACPRILIDKDTILCCSFAEVSGSFGCFVHNRAFEFLDINYIYKSFSVKDISKALLAMKALNIKGAGITMPYKKSVIDFLDDKSHAVQEIGACNTVVNNNQSLFGENTDFLGLKNYLLKKEPPANPFIYILGNGGMSLAVQSACKSLDIEFEVITRNGFDQISSITKSYIFNATPLKDPKLNKNNKIINANVETSTGMYLAILQASFQFKLYTNLEFPMDYIISSVKDKYNIEI